MVMCLSRGEKLTHAPRRKRMCVLVDEWASQNGHSVSPAVSLADFVFNLWPKVRLCEKMMAANQTVPIVSSP